MQEILDKIVEERKRQDLKWGADREQSDLLWFGILMEEVGEVIKAVFDHHDDLEGELIQAAAVAVAWLENIQRRHGSRRV